MFICPGVLFLLDNIELFVKLGAGVPVSEQRFFNIKEHIYQILMVNLMSPF